MSASDDFAATSLSSEWRFEGPAGVTSALGSSADDSWLELATPDGNFDVWNANNGARAMQDMADEDFSIKARFLSTPTERYQLQGFLIEQDADNWIRFDTYSDGGTLRAFAAVTLDGESTAQISAKIPGGEAPYLRVSREGDLWTMEYSVDGATWAVAGSFTQALGVSAAGVVAGNSAGADGFTALVDYFELGSDPLIAEDGGSGSPNLAPEAQDDTIEVAADDVTVIDSASLLGNDTDPDGDTLVISSVTQPVNGTLTDNGDGTWSYTPGADQTGVDTFSYTVYDGGLADEATVTLNVSAPVTAAEPFSDDFAAGALDPDWRIEGPAAISSAFGAAGNEAWLELVTPDGNHDIWNTNNAARVMQDTPDTDFVLETRFLSTPSQRFQMQGLLVEQDADTWIRFDTYSDGNALRAFAAVTLDGSSAVRISTEIPTDAGQFLRVTRQGDQWTMEYSEDGETWFVAGSFTETLSVSAAGVFAGNAAGATGYTAQVDYFETSLDPILSEDGMTAPPEATDDVFVTDAGAALVITAADLLSNDSDPDADPLSIVSIGTPDHGTLTDNGDGSWTYQPDAGFQGNDGFTYTVADGTGEDTASVALTVGTPPPPEFQSDDFFDVSLDSAWEVVTPLGSSQGMASDGDEAFLTLTTGSGDHDIWKTNNAARVMQDVEDVDFAFEARFLSVPTEKYEIQGFVIEADADNWLRFDTYSDGSALYAFGAITVNGTSSTAFRVEVSEGTAPYLRVERSGDTFTLLYSQDGDTWTEAGRLTHATTVAKAGVFAGSTGNAGSFTAQVDYVRSDASELYSEDGISGPPSAADDALATDAGTALVISAADLLANDSDPDNDALTIVSIGTPDHGTLTDNGDGTWTYQPDPGYQGYDSFTYTVTDGSDEDEGAVVLTVGTPPPPRFVSDDFNDDMLAAGWDISTPSGSDIVLTGDATDALLEISTSGGNYDLWGATRNAPRALQELEDEDFSLTARFVSTVSERHQMQGLLVEAEQDVWLRYDLYSDGSDIYAFAAVTVGGSSSVLLKEEISSSVQYIRLDRVGDVFTFAYSEDGVTWTTAGSATQTMAVTKAGVFAGSVGEGAALTARIDYVEAGYDPFVQEDQGYEPDPAPPLLGDDSFSIAPGDTLIFTVADLLGNDSDINDDTLVVTEITAPVHGTITDLGGGNYVFAPASGFEGLDTFSYTVSDGTFTSTAEVSILVDVFDAASDSFSSGSLSPVWEFSGIAGFAGVGYDGDEAFAMINSPAGVRVSASDVMTTPRILQDVLDLDFQISAGFLTEPSQQYQEHGLLVVQDDGNWIRFDLAYTSGSLTLIVGMIEDSDTIYPLFEDVEPGEVEELRITRDGDAWTFEYRGGGSDWIEAFSYDREMTVRQVGLFAGSTSNSGEVPGYTAYVDYFENSLEPISDEDGDYVPQNHAPVAVDDAVTVLNTLTFDQSDLLGNDYDPDVSDTLSIVSLGGVANGTLTDNGDGTWTYVPDEGFEGTESLSYTISDGALTSSATFTMTVEDPIDLWHGETQRFGSPGAAQSAINILGTVAANVVELSYSLNGGALRPLSIGPDTRRLHDEGDFNIDIDYAELDGSAADDVVTIHATLDSGAEFTRDVTVQYEAGNDWSPDYAIDWETVTDLRDVVQVVDGTWSWDADGVRPVDLGYDRLLVLGDQSWDNYELNLTITPEDLENADPRGRDGGAFAIGMLWGGHTDEPVSVSQPASGWEPGAAFFYTSRLSSHSYHSYSERLGASSLSLAEGQTYNATVRVEQTGLYDRVYSMRIWEEGTSEPDAWTLQTVETFSIDEAPATGAIYLNAHYYDVVFGDLSVTEITGNDIIQGDETDELMSGVDTGAPNPGRGEVDVFVGAEGADTFVFGNAGGSYYDDGIATDEGRGDFGFVWDFQVGTDEILLAGMASDYVLTEDHAGLPEGTAIWLAGLEDDTDELVGLLNGITGLDLNGNSFFYTGGEQIV